MSDLINLSGGPYNKAVLNGQTLFDFSDSTATENDVLRGKITYSKGRRIVGTNQGPTGDYAWGKYELETVNGTAVKGDLVEYVVDSNSTAYPDGSTHTDGYYYERAENSESQHCWAVYEDEPEIPIGDTRIEYIDTSATIYFDSGYLVNSTNIAKLKIVAELRAHVSNTSTWRVNGISISGLVTYLGFSNSNYFAYGNGTTDVANPASVVNDTNKHTFTLDYKNGKYEVDDLFSISFSRGTPSVQANYYIGCCNSAVAGTPTVLHAESVYKFSFYEDDVLVKNLIPVLQGGTIPCLYDTVSKTYVYPRHSSSLMNAIGNTSYGDELGTSTPKSYLINKSEDKYPDNGTDSKGLFYVKMKPTAVLKDLTTPQVYCWQVQDRSSYCDIIQSYSPTYAGYAVNTGCEGWYHLRGYTASSWAVQNSFIVPHVFNKEDEVGISVRPCYSCNFMMSILDFDTYDLLNVKTYGNLYTLSPTNCYVTGTSLQQYTYSSNTGTIGAYVYGDKITVKVKNGQIGYYKNDALFYTPASKEAPDRFMFAMAAYQTANYFLARVELPGHKVIGYVTSSDINAYPNNGFGADGYYYSRMFDATPGTVPTLYTGANIPSSAFGNDGDFFVVTKGE